MTPSQKMIEAGLPKESDDTSEPVEPVESQEDLDLDHDQETSMVESVILHLISEHGVVGAVHMSEDEGHEKHGQCHAEYVEPHDESDIRFRPARILEQLKAAAEQRLVGPGIPTQPLRT